MKPRRPDSAKTQQTKRTLDSDDTKQDLNSSKFSETFSAGVNPFHQKPDQFKKYVSQKDKDPRFKNLVKQSKLEVIQQKSNKKEQAKPNYKPFQKKKDRFVQKQSKKVQQAEQKIQKPQDAMNLSKGFAEKNKQKMNSLKASIAQQKLEEQKNAQKSKPKINFGAFKVNNRGIKKESSKESEQIQAKKQTVNTKQKQVNVTSYSNRLKTKKGKTEQELLRQQQMKELEKYVSEVQARNMEIFPSNYDRVVFLTPHDTSQLQKIDLRNFLLQPTQDDYERMKYRINELDQEIDNQKGQQSIDLEQIIDGDTQTENESSRNQSFWNSMTSDQLKKRNAFLTEVLCGKISKKQINQLEEMDKSAMRIYKLEHQQKQQEDDEIQLTEINMVKKQSNRLMQRNRLEAAGHLYRDCDYLSEEHQRRIEQLLNGEIGHSPFQCNQLEALKRRGIDQGIRMYRQMSGSQELVEILSEETLPKDPSLKKQAQKKVLKQKMNSVNERLANVDKVVVTKTKIQSMIKSFEHTRRSAAYQQLHQQNMCRFQQQYQHLQEAQRLLSSLSQKQNFQEVMKQIQEQFANLQHQIKSFQELDEQQLRRLQKQRLRRKLKALQKIQSQNENFEKEIQNMQRIKREIQDKLQTYQVLQQVTSPQLVCEGHKAEQTLQDIDEVIKNKMSLMKNSGL